VNNTKVPDETWTLQESDLLAGRWAVVRRGKRNLAGVRAVAEAAG
jgi:tyrosyl-tRNA synthetase